MTRRFSDPVAQVVIRDRDTGDQWHLGSPGFPFLTLLTMTFDANMTSSVISIGVDIPYEYAIDMLDTQTTAFGHNNQVKARLGYATGGWTDWVYGTMSGGGKGLSMSPDGLSGTFEADVVPIKAAGYVVPKDIVFESGGDLEKFLTLTCKSMGYEAVFSSDVEGKIEEVSGEVIKAQSTEDDSDAIGGIADKNSWDAMKYICNEYLDCKYMTTIKGAKEYIVFYSDREKMVGVLSDYNGSASDDVNRYVIRGVLDPSRNQYPCISFTPTDDAGTWIAGTSAGSGVNAAGIDTETGEDVSVDVAPEDQEEAIVGKIESTSPQDIRTTDNTGSHVADMFKNDERLGANMSAPILPGGSRIFENQARRFQRQGNPGLKMDITTIGVPEERTGNICELFGAGRLYNDQYYIDRITHSWAPGSWDMVLGVHRWGYKDVSGEQKETAGGQMPK